MLGHTFGHTQEQPSLSLKTPPPPHPPTHLVKIFTGEFIWMKLMQHLQVEICLLTDLPTTEDYFSFQLSFKIIVLLYYRYMCRWHNQTWGGLGLI